MSLVLVPTLRALALTKLGLLLQPGKEPRAVSSLHCWSGQPASVSSLPGPRSLLEPHGSASHPARHHTVQGFEVGTPSLLRLDHNLVGHCKVIHRDPLVHFDFGNHKSHSIVHLVTKDDGEPSLQETIKRLALHQAQAAPVYL